MEGLQAAVERLTADADTDVAFFGGSAMVACGDDFEKVKRVAVVDFTSMIPRVSTDSTDDTLEIIRPSDASSSYYAHVDELEI